MNRITRRSFTALGAAGATAALAACGRSESDGAGATAEEVAEGPATGTPSGSATWPGWTH